MLSLSRNILSIDIGTKNIKVVEGKYKFGNIVVDKLYMMPTPKDSIKDGRILNPQALEDSLNGLFSDNKIKTKRAIITTESTAIINRELTLPNAKPEELKKMIEFEVEQYLPIMVNQYVIEHKILEEFTEEDTKKVRVLVAAMPKEIAEGYLGLLKELKLKPIALDLHTNAISKLLDKDIKINNENYSLKSTVAVIDMGSSYLNLSIIEKGVENFSRIIMQGGSDIDVSIANSFNLHLDEAEDKKIKHGDMENLELGFTPGAMTNELIRSSIDEFIEGVRRLFKYYTSRNTANRIDQIYIYGGTSNIKGLTQYFSNALSIPTSIIKEVSTIKLSKNVEGELEYYLNAIASLKRR